MAEQNEKRANLLRSLQNGVNTKVLKRVRAEEMDVGPRAEKELIIAPQGSVESLESLMATKIDFNDSLDSLGVRQMQDKIL